MFTMDDRNLRERIPWSNNEVIISVDGDPSKEWKLWEMKHVKSETKKYKIQTVLFFVMWLACCTLCIIFWLLPYWQTNSSSFALTAYNAEQNTEQDR